MIDTFLFVGLPYIAIAVCIVVTVYRLKVQSFSQSALSSQFLERKHLLWGSVPWHIGIGLIILFHLLAFFFPRLWASLMASPTVLHATEAAGFGLGILAIVGLATLAVRRVTSSRLQSVTSKMDLIILLLLFFQVLLGLVTAAHYKWGASWATATVVPYVWSLLTLQPDASYVVGMKPVIQWHIILAWLIILLIPFSRLVHVFAFPLQYLWRDPQKVVWSNPRRFEAKPELEAHDEAKRHFVKSGGFLALGIAFLGVGTARQIFRFFKGPRLSEQEEGEIMATKVKRLEQTVEQKKYELEREQNDFIFISRLDELSEDKGKYFIDYAMSPGLAFADKDGLPLLISAKCTHLGCTVGNQADAQGKILCPCHISYFDIHTGEPNPGAPAKAPLPPIGWVLMDETGKMVARKGPDGKVRGTPDQERLDTYSVFIAKRPEEEA
jgi:nitrate reductase gamma subunit